MAQVESLSRLSCLRKSADATQYVMIDAEMLVLRTRPSPETHNSKHAFSTGIMGPTFHESVLQVRLDLVRVRILDRITIVRKNPMSFMQYVSTLLCDHVERFCSRRFSLRSSFSQQRKGVVELLR